MYVSYVDEHNCTKHDSGDGEMCDFTLHLALHLTLHLQSKLCSSLYKLIMPYTHYFSTIEGASYVLHTLL